MALTWTKKMIAELAEVLDDDYETVEDAAHAALDAAWELIKGRAKFTVVGQVQSEVVKDECDNPEHKRWTGDKVALGYYATEKQAITDALKMAYSTQTHETARAWVLPIFNDTPSQWYVSRKKANKDLAVKDGNYREAEQARRVQWFEDHPGEPVPLDWTVEVAFGNQTDDCEACHGLGKVPKPEIKRRSELDKTYY